MTNTAAALTANGATSRITYPQPYLVFAADGTYTTATNNTPATLARGTDGLIYATLDNSIRNDNTYRVLPTDTFEVI